MKHPTLAPLCAALLCAALAMPAGALAQQTTYVFPYEGFRYTQQGDETVLTQTNLDDHADLLASLGTTKEAVLASYIASGIVMEVIPENGGQIAVSVVSAGAFADVQDMAALSDARLADFAAQFENSGLYETCALTQTEPVCVRMTSSAMVASMPVYTLRYATLHLGQLYLLTQTVVGRAPDEGEDARVAQVLAGMKLLQSRTEPTPEPTPAPTPTPEPTPEPTPGVAQVIASEGELTVEGVPAYTNSASLTLTGQTAASVEVRAAVDGATLGRTTSRKDGAFSMTVSLPEEGDLVLAVMTDDAEQMLSLRYEMPSVPLTVTDPAEPVFTGDTVTIKGITAPEATVYLKGTGVSTNVKASKNGVYSIRVTFKDAGTQTFSLRAALKGYRDTETTVTLTRELTDRERLTAFRVNMIDFDYANILKDPARYEGKHFKIRGKVMEFTDYDGSPCALVCANNASVGVWYDPVWVVLDGTEDIAEESILTFYIIAEGTTLPADGRYTEEGEEIEAPVARAFLVTEAK